MYEVKLSREVAQSTLTNVIKQVEDTLAETLGENNFCFYFVVGWNVQVEGSDSDYQVISALYKSQEPEVGYIQLLNLNKVISSDPFTVASVLHNAVDYYINAVSPKAHTQTPGIISFSDKLPVQ